MNNFINFYNTTKPLIQNSIKEFNNSILKENNSLIKDNLEVFAKLNENGKMIRGVLICLGYKLNNSVIDHAIPLSTAYEVFETSILVHDDIIDNDNLRRGQQTIPYYNKSKYKDYIGNAHFSDSIGICIGDYGLYKSNELIINNYSNDNHFKNILLTFNDTVINTIRGEILDVIIPFVEKNKILNNDLKLEDNILEIYKFKTAYYTLVGPLTLGMILGNNKDDEVNDIINFSLPLGIAFQIQDDLLGIYSDDKNMGKTVGSDIKEFKQTLLYSYTKQTDYYDELMKYYGSENINIDEVKNIFSKCGAKDYCINKMNELYDESLNILSKITWLKDDDKAILSDLIDFLKNRKK